MKLVHIILIISLLISFSYCISIKKKIPQSSIKKIEELRAKKNTWQSIALELALLQSYANGPLDSLIEALTDIITDLDSKLERSHAEFEKRTNNHNSEIQRMNHLITVANNDIANTQNLLNEILYPFRAQVINEITQLDKEMGDLTLHIDQIKVIREKQNTDFQQNVKENEEAIAAIAECLSVISQLKENPPNLLQIRKKVQNSMGITVKKLKKSKEHAILSAFVKMASSFANTEALDKVVELMLSVKENLEISLQKFNEQELIDQSNFEADVQQSHDDIHNKISLKSEKQSELANTEERIESSLLLIEERNYDKVILNGEIFQENQTYEIDTQIFNDLVAQYNSEQTACQEALSILSGAEFEGYISDRIGQISDHVISTQHGSGVSTGADVMQFK